MNFGRSILSPSYSRKPHFRSGDTSGDVFSFPCLNCDQTISIQLRSLLDAAYDGGLSIGEETLVQAKEFYRIGVVGRSQDGGWPSMIIIRCDSCHIKYLIYAGVDEPRNSMYLVTIQGITEIVENEEKPNA